MKEIANLARIVTSRQLITPPLLDFESKEPNKERQLVSTLVANPDTTLIQGVKTIYGASNGSNKRALRRMVLRVQDKLLNHLYFLDHSDERHLVSRRYEMECLETLHKATILYSEGEYILTERLLRKCLMLAREADFTQYAVQAAQMLRTLYSEQRQTVSYDNMAKQLLQLQQIQALEQEGDRLYADTRQALARTVATKREVLPKLPGYIKQLEALHKRAKTFNTFNFLYQLQLAYAELRGDYEEIIEIATKAGLRVQDGKINPKRFDRRLNQFVIIYAHLQSRQPVDGLKRADAYARNFHTTSSNWLYFHENHWLLAMHAERYEQARRLLTMAFDSVAYSKLREAARQRWELYAAYLEFVLPEPRPTAAQRRQREQLFLSLPEHSNDKLGHNINILVLQMLHFLRQQDLEEVLVRSERLRKYQQRHLRETGAARTRLFLRLLYLIVERNFDSRSIAERSKLWLQKLQDTPMPGGAYAETEILPYENLWAMAFDLVRAWDSDGKIDPNRLALAAANRKKLEADEAMLEDEEMEEDEAEAEPDDEAAENDADDDQEEEDDMENDDEDGFGDDDEPDDEALAKRGPETLWD